MSASGYRGRFAPSPTGDLHAGSLAAALASWLDARARGGAWLLRIEDLDPPREVAGASGRILAALAAFGMESDEPVVCQSRRGELYRQALERLDAAGLIYGCSCSRRMIAAAQRRLGLAADIYPGTCRQGAARPGPQALRVRVPADAIGFDDRARGRFEQHLARDVGDFVVRRADGLWAYQLAVVVDDAEQGITDVVRGADLLDNTPRQIWLQRALRLPTPRYLHVPVVTNARGEKLSKQTGARALDTARPLAELERAWTHLGFPELGARSVSVFLDRAIALWRSRWCPA
ncbi:MAG: tRNA glutamyl-Q(34) synthetase GluQRS [Burkholderiaceae bacterium]|jgi:glutamyl-Q tRNA(Asp) synthetase|nr:tRNA glutamyl-Q(34) synthetase GluQRS [Burkholderiaceae bacterium]